MLTPTDHRDLTRVQAKGNKTAERYHTRVTDVRCLDELRPQLNSLATFVHRDVVEEARLAQRSGQRDFLAARKLNAFVQRLLAHLCVEARMEHGQTKSLPH